MRVRRAVRAVWPAWIAATWLSLTGGAAAGPTDLQLTAPVLWVLVGLSVGGATITWGIMAYALWRFRDPATRRRRYG